MRQEPNAITTNDQFQRLDDWYRLLRGIYFDRNFYRTPESIMCHLVEVVGALSIVSSGKLKAGISAERFLAKSLGWWMALCGHVGIRSVEAIVWLKFPDVCTYCQLPRHDERECRRKRAASGDHHWPALSRLGRTNQAAMPSTMTGWLDMFQRIYPRDSSTDHQRNFSRLTEELGGLAEAVRSLPLTKSYFVSEASDVFGWLMGVANQLRNDVADAASSIWESTPDGLSAILLQEYPGKCRYCRGRSCKCPPFPKETRGRIVHEGPSLNEQDEDPYFTTKTTLYLMDLGDEFITVSNQDFAVGREVLAQTQALGVAFRKFATTQGELGQDVVAALGEIRSDLESIYSEELVTQESVDEVLNRLDTLPGPVQQALIPYIQGVGAGLWAEWIKIKLGIG